MKDGPPHHRAFTPLLLILILVIALNPVLLALPGGAPVFDLVMLGVVGSAVYAVSGSRRELAIGLVLGIPAALGRIWVMRPGAPDLVPWSLALLLAFLVYVAVRIFREVFRPGPVTRHTVRGGISLYLLIGLIWAVGFAILESLSPGAFRHEELVGREAVIQVFVYYSLVTLSTLGYGDVVPILPVARSLAAIEAIVGQLYIAVFVATLVARLLTREDSEPS
jgi:hypothetical protein